MSERNGGGLWSIGMEREEGGGKGKVFLIGCKGDLIDEAGCNGFLENGELFVRRWRSGGLLRLGRGL